MKKYKIFIRFLVGWHFFISFFAIYWFLFRINRDTGIDIDKRFPIPEPSWFERYGFNLCLLLMALVGILSAVFLIVQKKYGQILSVILGVQLLLFGSFLFWSNFNTFLSSEFSFFWKLYNLYFGASGGYVDLICIGYGIFAIVYFTHKNVKNYLSIKHDTIKTIPG